MSIKKRVADRGADSGADRRDRIASYRKKRQEAGEPVKKQIVRMLASPRREIEYKKAVQEGKVGRPPEPPIDFEAFEGLCKIQCTQLEIAAFFKRSEDTIKKQVEEHYNSLDEDGLRLVDKAVPECKVNGDGKREVILLEYKEIVKRLYATGRISLRRAQFKTAIQSEHPVMQIWLGKQMLGQQDVVIPTDDTDKQQVEFDIRENLYNEESPVSPIAQDAASLS
jgi:hypothetical protein